MGEQDTTDSGAELVAATGEAPAVDQVPFGPALRDPDLLAGHAERGVVAIPGSTDPQRIAATLDGFSRR